MGHGAAKPGLGAQLARALLKKFPKASTLQLGRMLCKDNPQVFVSLNAAVLVVRRLRGAQGNRHRRVIKDQIPRPAAEVQRCQRWGSLLPTPDPNHWEWRDLPTGVKRWLILSDLHIPYHDHKAITAALEYAHGDCTGVLLNGDILDCYALSKFQQDPRKRRFKEELEDANRFLDALEAWGAKKIVLSLGNHESRLERYLMQKAPELLDVVDFSFASFLRAEPRKMMVVDSMEGIQVGKLSILHGHEFGGGFSSPVNPARGVYLKGRECVLVGHEHRTSEHTEQTMIGTTITCWSTGCMCDLHPAYRPLNRWNHGAAILDLSGKDWRIDNFRIVQGRVV